MNGEGSLTALFSSGIATVGENSYEQFGDPPGEEWEALITWSLRTSRTRARRSARSTSDVDAESVDHDHEIPPSTERESVGHHRQLQQ